MLGGAAAICRVAKTPIRSARNLPMSLAHPLQARDAAGGDPFGDEDITIVVEAGVDQFSITTIFYLTRSSGDAMGAARLVMVGGVGIAASMLLPALAKAKVKANAMKSSNNAKQLGLGLIVHTQDNDGRLPTADKWCDAILRDVGTPVFVSPQDPASSLPIKVGQKVSSYAFNTALSGKNLNEVNPGTVIVFETDLGWNGSGGLKDALEFLEFAFDIRRAQK